MRFWDSSAIVCLLLKEKRSTEVLALLRDDPALVVWCLTEVEIESALSRRVREGLFKKDELESKSRLRIFAERWEEIVSLDLVRNRALRLLKVHSLTAADSLQLAAALVFCDERPDGFGLVCLDERLAGAARLEGFDVLPSI